MWTIVWQLYRGAQFTTELARGRQVVNFRKIVCSGSLWGHRTPTYIPTAKSNQYKH